MVNRHRHESREAEIDDMLPPPSDDFSGEFNLMEDEPEGQKKFKYKIFFQKIFAWIFSSLLFLCFTWSYDISSWQFFGLIFAVNLIIKIVVFIISWILFDLILRKKFYDGRIFTTDLEKFVYSFIYNFFAIVLLTTIYIALRIYNPNVNIFLLYLGTRLFVMLFCTIAAKLLSKNMIAVIFISLIFGILITVSVMIFSENMLGVGIA
jgi:hypothetical protein